MLKLFSKLFYGCGFAVEQSFNALLDAIKFKLIILFNEENNKIIIRKELMIMFFYSLHLKYMNWRRAIKTI